MSFVHSKDFVTNLDDQCIQPNAVDLRLESLEEFTRSCIDDHSLKAMFRPVITISETEAKEFASRRPCRRYENGYKLEPGTSYDVVTKHTVKIPEGMVGWCHIRSTLSRNGLILSGGLYDAGYNGTIGFTLHNLSGNVIRLEDNVRIAQFIMGEAETSHAYSGYYNNNGGLSK